MDLTERIAIAKTNTARSNCFGTMMFLVGAADTDTYQDARAKKYLSDSSNLIETPRPELEGIFVIRYVFDGYNQLGLKCNLPMHTGVFVSLDPLMVVDRKNDSGSFRELPFVQVEKEYDLFCIQTKFYRTRNSPYRLISPEMNSPNMNCKTINTGDAILIT